MSIEFYIALIFPDTKLKLVKKDSRFLSVSMVVSTLLTITDASQSWSYESLQISVYEMCQFAPDPSVFCIKYLK